MKNVKKAKMCCLNLIGYGSATSVYSKLLETICKNYRPQVKQSELEYRLSHLLRRTCLHNACCMEYQLYQHYADMCLREDVNLCLYNMEPDYGLQGCSSQVACFWRISKHNTYIHNQFYKCLGVMISRFNISLCMQRCANVLAPSAGLPCTGDLNRSAFNLVPHVYYHYFSPSILFH